MNKELIKNVIFCFWLAIVAVLLSLKLFVDENVFVDEKEANVQNSEEVE